MLSWAGNGGPAVGQGHVVALCQLHWARVISVPGSCPWALAAAQYSGNPLSECDNRAGTPIPVHHLLPNERHSLGGLRHLLGNEEEEDSLGQEDIDGDSAFLPTRCQGGGKAEIGMRQCCGHCPPLAKSPHPKVGLSKSYHEALAVEYLEIHSPHPKYHRSGGEIAAMVPSHREVSEPFLDCHCSPCTSLCPQWWAWHQCIPLAGRK